MAFSPPSLFFQSLAHCLSPSSTSETTGENEVAIISEYDLNRINNERRKARLSQLTRTQAAAAISRHEMERRERNDTSDFSVAHFLIGYTTGIPLPSVAGIAGAMMSPGNPPLPRDAHHVVPEAAYEGASEPVHILPTNEPEHVHAVPDTDYKSGDSAPAYDSPSTDSGGGGGGGD